MKRLLIDTANQALILILADNEQVIDYVFEIVERDHSTRLMPCIDLLLSRNKMKINELKEAIVSSGPGSYTGIRIGVVVAKTLSYALNIPLKKISSLKLMSASLINKAKYIVPMIDARRRRNVFASVYHVRGKKLENIISDNIYPYEELINNVLKITNEQDVYFISNKFPDYIIKDNRFHYEILSDNFNPNLVINEEFEIVSDIHNFVPNYHRLTEAEMNLK